MKALYGMRISPPGSEDPCQTVEQKGEEQEECKRSDGVF